jgi:hypothetical protein
MLVCVYAFVLLSCQVVPVVMVTLTLAVSVENFYTIQVRGEGGY